MSVRDILGSQMLEEGPSKDRNATTLRKGLVMAAELKPEGQTQLARP
jgi:hypothetical protein